MIKYYETQFQLQRVMVHGIKYSKKRTEILEICGSQHVSWKSAMGGGGMQLLSARQRQHLWHYQCVTVISAKQC